MTKPEEFIHSGPPEISKDWTPYAFWISSRRDAPLVLNRPLTGGKRTWRKDGEGSGLTDATSKVDSCGGVCPQTETQTNDSDTAQEAADSVYIVSNSSARKHAQGMQTDVSQLVLCATASASRELIDRTQKPTPRKPREGGWSSVCVACMPLSSVSRAAKPDAPRRPSGRRRRPCAPTRTTGPRRLG
jgi:hypothetical protein